MFKLSLKPERPTFRPNTEKTKNKSPFRHLSQQLAFHQIAFDLQSSSKPHQATIPVEFNEIAFIRYIIKTAKKG